MAFGYDTVVGFLPATFEQVRKDLIAKHESNAGPNVDLFDGPTGAMISATAKALTPAWQSLEAAYAAGFVGTAPGTQIVPQGSSLELLLGPKIGPKIESAKSVVTLELTASGAGDVDVPAGHAVVIVGESVPWTLVAPVTIPSGGSIDGDFAYQIPGPKAAAAGTSWSILNPIAGWLAAGPNTSAATPGRLEETDAEYRARYRASATSEVVAAVLASGALTASIIEWPHGYPDSYWGLPFWIELLVTGGTSTAIAEAIRSTKAPGLQTVGNTTVILANAAYVGGQTIIKYSTPVQVTVYVEVTVVQGQGYPTDDSAAAKAARENAIKNAVVAHFNGLAAGQSTSSFAVATAVATLSGITGFADLVVELGLSPPPVTIGVIVAELREKLATTANDVTVVGA